MAFNGSGVFQVYTPGTPYVTGTIISSTVANNVNSDFATGLSTCITKNGQTTITANIPFATNKITGLGAATARTDAASLATIQDGTGVYVATVGGTADVITLTPSPPITAYVAGQKFSFIASGANTTNVTVAISSLAAKAITKNGSTALIAGDLPSGAMIEMEYDGTRFQLVTAAGTVATAATLAAINNNSTYRTIHKAEVFLLAGVTADTFNMPLSVQALGPFNNGSQGVGGINNNITINQIYIAAADYPTVGALTTKLRVRVELLVNDVAPTGNFTVGLYPITRPGTSGGAGNQIITLGTVVAGSTVLFTTPANDAMSHSDSGDFAIPADGHYVLGLVTTATVAASSRVDINATLQMHNT